jgi:hypothetical protein
LVILHQDIDFTMEYRLVRLCRSTISQAFLSHCGSVKASGPPAMAPPQNVTRFGADEREHPMRGLMMVLVVASAGLAAPALAQTTPDTENGRYTFSTVPDGLMRLDTRTGQVSLCSKQDAGWACNMVPDERAALDNEIARLQRENGAMKKDMLARNLPLPGGVSGAPPSAQNRELNLKVPLPSDAEVDRVMSAFEKMWRRLVDIVQRTPGGDKI